MKKLCLFIILSLSFASLSAAEAEVLTLSDSTVQSADSVVVIDLETYVFEQSQVLLPAEFIGGIDSLFAFLDRNIVFPEGMERSEAEGRKVLISFIVEPDGYLSGFTYAERTERALELAALETALLLPRWIPAETVIDGQLIAVRSKVTIPIFFIDAPLNVVEEFLNTLEE